MKVEPHPTQWRIGKRRDQAHRGRFSFSGQQLAVSMDSILWSLADLMTLLLIFFIMLYSDAARRPMAQPPPFTAAKVEAQSEASGPVADISREEEPDMAVLEEDRGDAMVPEIFRYETTQSEDPPPEAVEADLNRQVMTTLADSISEDFYVRWEDKQPVIVLGERITFDVGQAVLLPAAKDALRRVARLISQHSNSQVVVTGHTDNRPIHTNAFPSNWELSAGRAASVAKALVDSGVPSNCLIIQGQAQFKPLVSNANETNRQANRRVEISLITQ